jgi:hypothetical protein
VNGYRQRRVAPQPPPAPPKPMAEPETKATTLPQHGEPVKVPLGLIVAGGAGVLVLVVALLLFSRDSAQPHVAVAPSVVVLSPTAVVAPPTPTPACTPATTYLDIITHQELTGDWAAAAATAETALGLPQLCSRDRAALTEKAVNAGLHAIYTTTFLPTDLTAHEQIVDRYLALRTRAEQVNVPFPTPLQVAQEAYQSGQFALAKVAVEEALERGQYDPDLHREVTRLYISTLYNLGVWYTSEPANQPLVERGARFFVASHCLAVEYQTGQAEAWGKLTELLGKDFSAWPHAEASPVMRKECAS